MPKTVGDLKKILADFPDDAPVVLAKDSEGNDFKGLQDHSDALVDMDDPDGEWHDFDGEGSGMDDEEWQAFKARARRILVLWP